MPTLKFYGVDKEVVVKMSQQIVESIATIFEIPEDHINMLVDNSTWIDKAGVCKGFPLVKILAFKRDNELEKRVAAVLDKLFESEGYSDAEIFFIHLDPKNYYYKGASY